MNPDTFSVSMHLEERYRFRVDFHQEGVPALTVDEPPPLGGGEGPNPARLLAVAVGSCMSASLKFCLERARVGVVGMQVQVDGSLQREEGGRLRVAGLRVRLVPQVEPGQAERLGRCTELFEDFCIVGQSVRRGIDVDVEVAPAVVEVATPVS